jgi:hypothetical protein
MPDWSAGTKELHFALIAGVGAVSVPAFHRQVFHVEHYFADRTTMCFWN